MTIITQLYRQLYTTFQLHVSANTIFGHLQVGYTYRRKITQYIIWCNITISVGVSRGDEMSFTKAVEGTCAEGLICRSVHVMLRLWFHKDLHYCWRYQWHVMYNWQYSCVMTVMSVHNCFLTQRLASVSRRFQVQIVFKCLQCTYIFSRFLKMAKSKY